MNTLCLTSKISRNNDVAYTQIDSDMVILEPNMNNFCKLNPTGAELWNLLEQEELTLQEMCKHLHANYEITEEQCVEDVKKFIEDMALQQLLIVTN